MNLQFCPQSQTLALNSDFQNTNFVIQQIFFQAERWRNVNHQLRKDRFQPIDLKKMGEFQLACMKTNFERDCPKIEPLIHNSSFPAQTHKREKVSNISIPVKIEIETNIKNEVSLFEEDKTFYKYIKEEAYNYKQEYNISSEDNHNARSPTINDVTSNQPLRDLISNMLFFFIRRFGKACQNEINQQRIQFAHNKQLLKVFDILVDKYHASTKSKEDMVRFCVRKALAFLRNNLKNELKTTQRDASLALCKKYFQDISGKIKAQKIMLQRKQMITFSTICFLTRKTQEIKLQIFAS